MQYFNIFILYFWLIDKYDLFVFLFRNNNFFLEYRYIFQVIYKKKRIIADIRFLSFKKLIKVKKNNGVFNIFLRVRIPYSDIFTYFNII